MKVIASILFLVSFAHARLIPFSLGVSDPYSNKNGMMNGNMNGKMNGKGKMNGNMNGMMNGNMNGNMNGMMNGNMNGMMNGMMNTNKGGSTGGVWHGKGVDVSEPCSNWSCLKQSGYNYAIIRIFQETGSVDPNGVASVKAAQAAGLTTDVYMFPAGKSTTTGAAQAQKVLAALKGVSYGRIWIDIEGVGSSWGSSTSANTQLFKDIVSTLSSGGAQIGVYTQGWQWNSIMGSSTAGAAYPLWYAEYGNGPGSYNTADGTCQYSGSAQSLASFSKFGGWTKAYAKQYNGDCTKCGCSIDVNYAP